MFQITNVKTGKAIKDAITCKPKTFESAQDARHFADCMERNSILNATAWNSVRRAKYNVVAA